ncbi:hypothetical protein CUMW_284730 [Citrus unshiu]|uniref:Uncharacterized protein n=1 Tax=Citrus unshiu TaxID=55188 RepID=A0A2H5N3V1_CITUN|nr:hypothetical protein CUMW_284730 [Citrus unshiu]
MPQLAVSHLLHPQVRQFDQVQTKTLAHQKQVCQVKNQSPLWIPQFPRCYQGTATQSDRFVEPKVPLLQQPLAACSGLPHHHDPQSSHSLKSDPDWKNTFPHQICHKLQTMSAPSPLQIPQSAHCCYWSMGCHLLGSVEYKLPLLQPPVDHFDCPHHADPFPRFEQDWPYILQRQKELDIQALNV